MKQLIIKFCLAVVIIAMTSTITAAIDFSLKENINTIKRKENIMLNIVYWSDYACPYCYIGEARLEKAIEELGLQEQVSIETRAFELDPTAPKTVETVTVDRFAVKYRLTREQAQKQIDHISQLGIDMGIDFRYATTLYTNTREAHRLTKLAQSKNDPKLSARVSKLLFDAYFTRNEKLAERDVLLGVARDAGLDEQEAMQVLDSGMYDDEVRFDEREAMMRGVHGVPYFIINGKFTVPGALSVNAFKHTLQRALKEQQENATEENAHQCGSDGCSL